jgi:thermitase
VKIPTKKYLFPALVIAVILTGWQGLCASYAAALQPSQEIIISSPQVNSPRAVSGLTENEDTDDPAVITYTYMDLSGPESESERYPQNSPAINTRWTAEQIKAVSALDKTGKLNDAAPVLIAVLDTGIDAQHKELYGKVVSEVNFTASDTADDIYGHGTSIAGIITEGAENDPVINGVASESRLLNVKVADDRGRCQSSVLARGIIWAVDQGAEVINISLEIREDDPEIKEAVDYAWNRGVVIIAAAGNDGSSSPVYPAFYDNCLAVTAVKDDMSLVPLANYGDWVDVGAPGYKIYSALPGNKYGYKYGTSLAAAYISRLAGELFSIVEDTNGDGRLNDEVRRAIEAGYEGFVP